MGLGHTIDHECRIAQGTVSAEDVADEMDSLMQMFGYTAEDIEKLGSEKAAILAECYFETHIFSHLETGAFGTFDLAKMAILEKTK